MAEIPLPEDEAVRYVLGELGPAERHRFEARLEKSDELRALVRELEAGMVAAALASPQRNLPPSMWPQIERAVAEEGKRVVEVSAFRRIVRRQAGWWAAAACLLGWVLYGFRVNHAQLPAKPGMALSENNSRTEIVTVESSRRETSNITLPQPAATNSISPRPQRSPVAQAAEIAALRQQVRNLETQVTQLSQVLTQQQALPFEGAQFTFFQLTPRSPNGDPVRISAPSPELQRALFFAMARELGWLRGKDAGSQAAGGTGQDSKSGVSDAATADPQIVYLTPPGADSQHHTSDGNENLSAQSGKSSQDDPGLASSGIPMAKSGSNVLMAIDPSIVPVGSTLNIWNGTQLVGTLSSGDGTTVVSFSAANSSGNPFDFSVTSGAGGAWLSTTNH